MGAYKNWNKLKSILEDRASKHPLDFSHNVLIMMDEIENPDIEEMHDTIRMCYDEIFDKKPSLNDMETIISKIPQDLKEHADQWGWDDTEVRDRVYEWIEDNFNG
jgi:hypothetical protein